MGREEGRRLGWRRGWRQGGPGTDSLRTSVTNSLPPPPACPTPFTHFSHPCTHIASCTHPMHTYIPPYPPPQLPSPLPLLSLSLTHTHIHALHMASLFLWPFSHLLCLLPPHHCLSLHAPAAMSCFCMWVLVGSVIGVWLDGQDIYSIVCCCMCACMLLCIAM